MQARASPVIFWQIYTVVVRASRRTRLSRGNSESAPRSWAFNGNKGLSRRRGIWACVLAAALLAEPSLTVASDTQTADRAAGALDTYQATILKATERLRFGDARGGLALATRAVQREPRVP